MRLLISVLSGVLALTVALPVTAQPVRVVAVADFADDSTYGRLIDARGMNAVLGRLLTEQSKGHLRVAAGAEVRAAMEARRYGAIDLDYPSRAAEIARAVGADWLITGRWTYMEIDSDPMELPAIADSDAAINIRVIDAATRRILLEEAFWSYSSGHWTGLRWAAEGALQKAAERIIQLQVSRGNASSDFSGGPRPCA